MGYYIRVLSQNATTVPRSHLAAALEKLGAPVALTGDSSEQGWRQLVLSHVDGKDIAVVECDLVGTGSVAEEEIDEFVDEISDARPASAADWVRSYLRNVQAIYAIQVLSGAYDGRGWDAIDAIKNALMAMAGGIIQADNEGFTNEDGYHILWQFSDDVTGPWWMAVLKDGKWRRFEMDLGNPDHRAAFLAGEVPTGVETIE